MTAPSLLGKVAMSTRATGGMANRRRAVPRAVYQHSLEVSAERANCGPKRLKYLLPELFESLAIVPDLACSTEARRDTAEIPWPKETPATLHGADFRGNRLVSRLKAGHSMHVPGVPRPGSHASTLDRPCTPPVMTLPFAQNASVEGSKIRGYLLSAEHPVGPYKAAVFAAYGWYSATWENLRDDLRIVATEGTAQRLWSQMDSLSCASRQNSDPAIHWLTRVTSRPVRNRCLARDCWSVTSTTLL